MFDFLFNVMYINVWCILGTVATSGHMRVLYVTH